MTSKPLILIIDDNEPLAEVIAEFLNQLPLMTKTLSHLDHIKQIEDLSPNLILLDLELPGLSGEEILQLLYKSSKLKDIPVVVLTAKINLKRTIALEHAQAILQKPVDLDYLVEQILHFLR